jgi:GDPmannose 4,6-dehydratase
MPVGKTALIVGIGGQDGSYLAEHLLALGYEVHGVHRRTSTGNLSRLTPEVLGQVHLHQGDLTDTNSIMKAVQSSDAEEIYNLADQDDVRWSFDLASYNFDVTGAAVGRLLHALSIEDAERKIFQPISATIFGDTVNGHESTPLFPRSPYACAKAFALHLCQYYREQEGLHVGTAILFNHDSPRRGPGYLLQKICRHIADSETIPALHTELERK